MAQLKAKRRIQQGDPWYTRVKRYLEIGAKIAQLAVHLKSKPTKLDYFALGVTGIDAALEVWEQVRSERHDQGYNYFDRDKGWEPIPFHLLRIIFPMMEHTRVEQRTYQNKVIFMGTIGEERLGWIGENQEGAEVSMPFHCWYRKDRLDQLLETIQSRIWKNYGTPHLSFNAKGLTDDPKAKDHVLETGFIQQLEHTITQFLKEDMPMGYLLEGLPGTGKTTAILYLVHKMGLKSLRIELTAFDDIATEEQFLGFAPSVELLLRVLRPDVVIIDDLDRIHENAQPRLLTLLELMHKMCKVILVSVNTRDAVLTPLLRPDRLDEHIKVPFLEPAIVLEIVGEENKDLVEQFKKWPIVYIKHFMRRSKALGNEVAREGIAALQERIEYAEKENKVVAVFGRPSSSNDAELMDETPHGY